MPAQAKYSQPDQTSDARRVEGNDCSSAFNEIVPAEQYVSVYKEKVM